MPEQFYVGDTVVVTIGMYQGLALTVVAIDARSVTLEDASDPGRKVRFHRYEVSKDPATIAEKLLNEIDNYRRALIQIRDKAFTAHQAKTIAAEAIAVHLNRRTTPAPGAE